MVAPLIHDRGRGPEVAGTRITVYNLLPYFLDPTATEEYICRACDLTPAEVAAARAYVLDHADTVLAEHLRIEARIAAGNAPEVAARAEQTHATFLQFKQWLAERAQADPTPGPMGPELQASGNGENNGAHANGPSFREWLRRQDVQPTKGS